MNKTDVWVQAYIAIINGYMTTSNGYVPGSHKLDEFKKLADKVAEDYSERLSLKTND
jgi:hypothetical protein